MANEKRLIDVTPLIDECVECMGIEWNKSVYTTWAEAEEDFRDRLLDAPTVDAVEVVHGRWIDKTKVIVKPPFPPIESARVDCSVCGHIFWHTSALTYNYCPNCGAKMDGDGNV